MNLSMKKAFLFFGIAGLSLMVGILGAVSFLKPDMSDIDHGDMEKYSAKYNKEVIVEKNEGVKKLLAEGRYKCCILKPCSYCFSDPEHQDEDLVCDCLEDLMNGKSPCGECLGEILEGNGNPLIAEYFAVAIAEKLGEQYTEMLKQIIFEKYDIPVKKQL